MDEESKCGDERRPKNDINDTCDVTDGLSDLRLSSMGQRRFIAPAGAAANPSRGTRRGIDSASIDKASGASSVGQRQVTERYPIVRSGEYVRLHGQFRRSELADVLEMGREYLFAQAGRAADGSPLITVYRREVRDAKMGPA